MGLNKKLEKLLDSQFEEYIFYLEEYFDDSMFPSNKLTRREQVEYLMQTFNNNILLEVFNRFF